MTCGLVYYPALFGTELQSAALSGNECQAPAGDL
jgi:hypothetical protein